MSNMAFCPLNVLDMALLTATPSALETMPVSNLQLPYRGRTLTTTSTAQQIIEATWSGQGHYMNMLALYRHNLSPSATVRVQIFSDAAVTSQIYDSGAVPAYEALPLGAWQFGTAPLGSSIFDGFKGLRFSVFYFPRLIAGSLRITITDTANPDGFLQVSRLFGGDTLTLQWNPSSLDFGLNEGTEQNRTPTGSLRRQAEEGFRAGSVKIEFTSEDQANALLAMLSYAGLRKDMFFSIYPGSGGVQERDHTFIGALVGKLPKIQRRANSNIRAIELVFEETA